MLLSLKILKYFFGSIIFLIAFLIFCGELQYIQCNPQKGKVVNMPDVTTSARMMNVIKPDEPIYLGKYAGRKVKIVAGIHRVYDADGKMYALFVSRDSIFNAPDTIHPKPINPLYLKKLDTLEGIEKSFLGTTMTHENYIYWNNVFSRIILELRTDSTLNHK